MAIFAAWVTFANHEERLRIRPKHREYLDQLLTDGKLVESGPFADESGALLIYEAESEAAVRQLMDADPYNSVGAFGQIEIREWRRLYATATPELRPAPIG